jgi:hypothetical protein
MIIFMNLAMVVVSWLRFVSFFLVISSMSKLLMTLLKMITACITFLFIVLFYIMLMVPIFYVLFNELTINYVNQTYIFLTLYDTLISGAGIFYTDDLYKVENDILMLFHVLFSNVFLLNYLVAILSTVYESMLEKGDFAYKSNKYMYIERFYIPMQDQWGYTELVVHPPPMNYISSLLLCVIFKPGLMKRCSDVISKLIFWIENIYHIFVKLLWELLLVPFIYLRIMVNILRAATLLSALANILLWIFIGPFFLAYCLCNDMYFYSKILCDYREDDDATQIKNIEDE